MPPLAGFTSNPLRTRADLIRAAAALISPLHSCKSLAKARLRFPFQTAAGFDEISAQLEGFARPLFAVVPLLLNDRDALDEPLGLSSWIEGIASGVDPESPEYWGDIGDIDQRMVETESIAIALLIAPEVFVQRDDKVRENLTTWLRGIQGKRMPASNWRWFRVFVNLALVKALGVPREEVQEEIEADFTVLDSFYLGEGWSSDGLWGDKGSQADYYSGSFAIQFAQLLFARFAAENEYVERVQRYKSQAQEFAAKFWRFFDRDGAAIPFGRSMTYRFAFAAFWATAAMAKVDLPLSIGAVKGLLLRHLRWWAHEDRADMFHADGTMTIGFTYPNMYLSEDYNSPQSPYWCLKAFIVLALPESDEFWTVEEEDYPSTGPAESGPNTPEVTVIWPPRQIVVNDPSHHYLLSSGQSTTKPFKARDAKYGKFAYSSAFGFSVPSGPILHQTAPDSTLALRLSWDDTWRTRSSPQNVRLEEIRVGDGKQITGLTSTWRPQSHLRNLEIHTTLIPALGSLTGWHVRVHRVNGTAASDVDNISLVDGGFAIASCARDGRFIPDLQESELGRHGCINCTDDGRGALVSSWAGTSGIVDLTNDLVQPGSPGAPSTSATGVMRPDPNTNLIASRTMLPFVQHDLTLCSDARNIVFATAVFAVTESEGLGGGEVRKLWRRRPEVKLDCDGKLEVTAVYA